MLNNEDIVCYCSYITKGQIIEALANGAKDLEDIKKVTGACTLNKCYICHPRGVCCSTDILKIIEEYKKED